MAEISITEYELMKNEVIREIAVVKSKDTLLGAYLEEHIIFDDEAEAFCYTGGDIRLLLFYLVEK